MTKTDAGRIAVLAEAVMDAEVFIAKISGGGETTFRERLRAALAATGPAEQDVIEAAVAHHERGEAYNEEPSAKTAREFTLAGDALAIAVTRLLQSREQGGRAALREGGGDG